MVGVVGVGVGVEEGGWGCVGECGDCVVDGVDRGDGVGYCGLGWGWGIGVGLDSGVIWGM